MAAELHPKTCRGGAHPVAPPRYPPYRSNPQLPPSTPPTPTPTSNPPGGGGDGLPKSPWAPGGGLMGGGLMRGQGEEARGAS